MRLRAMVWSGALVAALGCGGERGPVAAEGAGSGAAQVASRLKWVKAQRATTEEIIELVGIVELAPDATHALSPPLSSRIVRWEVKPGQVVEPGALLAELEVVELRDLMSAQQAAAALLKTRQAQVEARRAEVAAGVRDVASLREVEVGASEAAVALKSVQAQLGARRLKAGSGGRWRWESPVAGVVEAVRCAPGVMTSPQEACLTVVEASKSAVRVDVPERYIGRLEQVREAIWRADGQEPVAVSMVRRASALDVGSHTLAVYLARPDAAGWTPGLTGRLELRGEAPRGAAQVPRTAVIELDGAPHVFVRGEGGAPVALKVERLGELEGTVIVRGAGLGEGVEVVSRGTFLLKSMALLGQEG